MHWSIKSFILLPPPPLPLPLGNPGEGDLSLARVGWEIWTRTVNPFQHIDHVSSFNNEVALGKNFSSTKVGTWGIWIQFWTWRQDFKESNLKKGQILRRFPSRGREGGEGKLKLQMNWHIIVYCCSPPVHESQTHDGPNHISNQFVVKRTCRNFLAFSIQIIQ